jgi:hypothetical protein
MYGIHGVDIQSFFTFFMCCEFTHQFSKKFAIVRKFVVKPDQF